MIPASGVAGQQKPDSTLLLTHSVAAAAAAWARRLTHGQERAQLTKQRGMSADLCPSGINTPLSESD